MAISILHRPQFPRSRQLHVKPAVIVAPLPIVQRIVAIVVALGGIVLDQTATGISSASLNFVQGSFALSPDEGSWILTAFNAAYYSSILASAWTITHFGRKRVLVTALFAFAASSALCIFAWNFEVLVELRALQGLTLGCVFVPATMTILVSVPPQTRGYAFLPFSFGSLAASTAGLFLAGIFVQYAQWQDAFAVTAGLATILAIAVIFVVPPDTSKKRRPFDFIGLAVIAVAATAFQYLVNEGERRNWFDDPNVTLALVVLIIAIVTLALWKLRFSRHPFVNLRMLNNRPFVLGALCAGLLSLAQYSGTLFVQYAQSPAVEMSPTLAGGLFALRIIGFAVAIFAVGMAVITKKLNVRFALTGALLAFAVLSFAQANIMTATADFDAFVPTALLIGLAQGAVNQPLPLLVFGSLTQAELPMGAIIYKMAPLLATSIGNAFSQRLLDTHTAQHLSDLAGSVTLSRPDVATFAEHGGTHALAAYVGQQASVLAYDDLTRLFALVALLIIPILYFIPLPGEKR